MPSAFAAAILLQRLLHEGVHKLLAVAAVAAHAGKLRA
jgi:hypothetical protein